MWLKVSDKGRAKLAAAELRKIADLLDRIRVDAKGQPHPEMAAIYQDLKAIRVELGKVVRDRGLSAGGRQAIANGFANIANSLKESALGR